MVDLGILIVVEVGSSSTKFMRRGMAYEILKKSISEMALIWRGHRHRSRLILYSLSCSANLVGASASFQIVHIFPIVHLAYPSCLCIVATCLCAHIPVVPIVLHRSLHDSISCGYCIRSVPVNYDTYCH